MLTKVHHWDFVDDDGCLHCNCEFGLIEPTPGSVPWVSDKRMGEIAWKQAHDDLYNRLTHMQAERDELRSDLAQLHLIMAENNLEIERLQAALDEAVQCLEMGNEIGAHNILAKHTGSE